MRIPCSVVYNKEGVVEVSRRKQVTQLEFPVRRSKGSQGNITVHWSLYRNESSHGPNLLWPTSGNIGLEDGEWNTSFIINLDDDAKVAPESVVWVQMDETTGGAVLGSHYETTAKVLITGTYNQESETGIWHWIVIGVCGAVVLIVAVVLFLVWRQRRKKTNNQRLICIS